MGLPGSGKTTYARYHKYARRDYMGEIVSEDYLDIVPLNTYDNYNSRIGIIDLDMIFQEYGDALRNKDGVVTSSKLGLAIHKKYGSSIMYNLGGCTDIFVDGLILNHKDCKLIIDTFLFGRIASSVPDIDTIIIDFWTPDIDVCLWNDKGRRDKLSKETIMNVKLTRPNIGVLRDEYGKDLKIEFVKHDVVRKPEYRMFFDNIQGVEIFGNYFYSDTWSLGGEAWGWDGSKRRISPEEPLNEFKEFDMILTQICPNITFLQYKKAYNYSVTTEELTNSDYYSRTTSMRYVCDIRKLMSALKDLGVI